MYVIYKNLRLRYFLRNKLIDKVTVGNNSWIEVEILLTSIFLISKTDRNGIWPHESRNHVLVSIIQGSLCFISISYE